MSHNPWFRSQPGMAEKTLLLPANLDGARAIAQILIDKHGARGELLQVEQLEGATAFRMNHPGSALQVRYEHATGSTKLTIREASLILLLNRVHHAAGLWHEYWLLNAFGWFSGVVSLLLFVIAGTGIYLWFKIHKERKVGAVLLGLNLLVLIPLVLSIRSAG